WRRRHPNSATSACCGQVVSCRKSSENRSSCATSPSPAAPHRRSRVR
ncbi:MAG: hypothetical protein AVDCRST_MAG32-2570, partial [uncultured Nocardioides sp.]